jgi:hypothetical protein
MCFQLGNESSGPAVQIGFEDAAAQRLFSSRDLLESQYAPPLPTRIMMRLSVLKAAPSLAAIPQKPPLSLRQVGPEDFLIDLDPPRVLRLRAQDKVTADLTRIKTVTIVGVA